MMTKAEVKGWVAQTHDLIKPAAELSSALSGIGIACYRDGGAGTDFARELRSAIDTAHTLTQQMLTVFNAASDLETETKPNG